MLTTKQVDQLFEFCRKRDVQYYDVQVELVDHLANAIEDKMTASPSPGFDEALMQVYKGFGKRGFGPLVKAREKAVRQYNHKLMWKLVKEQLGWPKIFVALTTFMITWLLLQLDNKWPVKSVVFICIVATTFVMTYAVARLQKIQKRSGKKFLLVNLAGIANLIYLPINGINVLNGLMGNSSEWMKNMSIGGALFFCCFFTAYIVVALATCQAISHVKEVLKKTYPAVFAAA